MTGQADQQFLYYIHEQDVVQPLNISQAYPNIDVEEVPSVFRKTANINSNITPKIEKYKSELGKTHINYLKNQLMVKTQLHGT